MEIFRAAVDSHQDNTKSGRFWAIINGDPQEVIYTTPYFYPHFHGVFAPPSPGSEILVAQDSFTKQYYYISTIVDYTMSHGSVSEEKPFGASDTSSGNFKPLGLVAESNAYNDAGQPQVMTFKNGQGSGLKITSYTKNSKSGAPAPLISKVSLQAGESENSNRLVIDNSPDSAGIEIRNKHGDGIVLTSSESVVNAGGTLNIRSTNSHSCLVKHGEYKVTVDNGRDLTLKNSSFGTYSFPNFQFTSPNPNINPFLQFGNINLVSKWRDINIYTDNPAITPPGYNSNVFISTDRGMIQLKSNGDVAIYANTGDVTIQGTSGLNLFSVLGDINIQAAGNINMKAANINSQALAGNINMKAVNINSQASLTVNSAAGTDINCYATNSFNAEGIVSARIGNSDTPMSYGTTEINPPGGTGAIVAAATIPELSISVPKLVTEQKFNVYGK